MRRLILLFSAFLVFVSSDATAQNRENPESFHIELTGSAWLVGPTGTIQADGTPINFVTDLAAGAQQPRFYGGLVFKPTRRQRIVLEGSPVSFSGINNINRSFVFRNNTYTVSQTVSTSASVNYFFAGYQYDVLSGRYGHLGFQGGVGYLGVDGTLVGVQSGISEAKSYQTPLPLIGTEFRIFPVPHHKIVEVEGMLRGIPAGSYGYFVEGGLSGGIRIGPVGLLGGYREMLADVHENNSTGNGVAMHLKGPIFSLQWQR